MMRSSGKLTSSLNWMFVCNIAVGILNFVSLAWFARNLGPKFIGDYAVLVTGIQLISSFFSAGFDQALIKIPNDIQISRAASYCTSVQALLLVLVAGVVGCYCYLSDYLSSFDLFSGLMILVSVVMSQASNLFSAPLAADLNYRFLSICRLCSVLVGFAVGIVSVYLGAGVLSLVLRDLSSAIVLLVLFSFKSAVSFDFRLDAVGVRRLFDFSKGLWVINSAEKILIRVDYAVVGLLLGKELLGVYFVVRSFVEGLLGFLIFPIQTVLFSYYCRLDNGMRRFWFDRNILFLYAFCVLILSVCAHLFGGVIFRKLIGSEYAAAFGVLPMLLAYAGAIVWFENIKSISMARGLHFGLIYPRLLQLLIFIASVFPLVDFFGVVGAGFATALGGCALAVSATLYLRTTCT